MQTKNKARIEVKIGPDVEYFLRKHFPEARRRNVASLVQSACEEIAAQEMRKAVRELDAKEHGGAAASALVTP